MLAQILVGALLVQSALGAPANCGELCEGQTQSSGYSSSSYNAKSTSYGHHYGSGSGLGVTGSRLENLDENVIGGLERPGTWKDEKHYITDDGRGEMKYRAGQTVSNNGFSKFAEHSYRYGSHDKHTPTANTQILSSNEFQRELQGVRDRISSFMGSFHLGSSSVVNANLLQEFKNKASLISTQMNDVCSQVDVGSSMYQQMQQEIQKFQREVEKRQQEMETMILQSSSSSSSSAITHGSQSHYTRPAPQPAPQYAVEPQYPTRPTVSEENLKLQRVEEEISTVETMISSFYTTFGRVETSPQYKQDLNAQVDTISQKFSQVQLEANNEILWNRINTLRSQFENYVSSVRKHIAEVELRNREDVERKKLKEQQAQLDWQQHQDKLRQLEEEKKRQADEIARIEQEQERIKNQQEQTRIRLQKQAADRLRIEQEEDRLRREREERLQRQEEEERAQRRETENLRIQEELRLQREREEHQRLLLQQQALQQQVQQQQVLQQQVQQQQLQQQQQQVVKPQTTSTLEVSGSSSYEHSIKGSYVSSPHQTNVVTSTGSAYTKPRPSMRPHVDLTAQMNRLQQDLHRLQTEVSDFNTYSMRLTSANSQVVVSEAEREAESLRQRIKNLCDMSGRYENQNILASAEDLKSRLEGLVSSFQSQAASYSASASYASESSYGTSGSYKSVHAPSISNVEYEHQKSTEVEVGRRPASQRYASGSSYNAQAGYSSHSSYGSGSRGQASQQQVECVEQYAGQPCVDQQRRYRRNVGGK